MSPNRVVVLVMRGGHRTRRPFEVFLPKGKTELNDLSREGNRDNDQKVALQIAKDVYGITVQSASMQAVRVEGDLFVYRLRLEDGKRRMQDRLGAGQWVAPDKLHESIRKMVPRS